MKPRNQNARKPDHLKTWNKGRITVDLGTARKERFISYAKHEKRTMKEIINEAIDEKMNNPDHGQQSRASEGSEFNETTL